MEPLPQDTPDEALIAFIDGWAGLLEREEYSLAFARTDHVVEMGWTADLLREVIQRYGDARPSQKVTVAGVSTDIRQRKTVSRWPSNAQGCIGEIWYDLNIDGVVSDLTATFDLMEGPRGITLHLNDVHVM